MLSSTVTIPEIIWLAVGVTAAVISCLNTLDALRDLHALRRSGRNGLLLAVAKGAVRQDVLRLAKSLLVTAIGAFAATQPPANRNQPVNASTIVITAGLFAICVCIVLGTMLSRHVRSLARRELRRRQGDGSAH